MCRILVVYEPDSLERASSVVEAVEKGARETGAEVRVAPLGAAGVRDIEWADALALGVEGRGFGLPREAKRWMDALGFSGWRAFRDKAGCVFPTTARAGTETDAACRMLARILRTRGMEACTPQDLGVGDALDTPGTESSCDGFGEALGASFAARNGAAAPVQEARSRAS